MTARWNVSLCALVLAVVACGSQPRVDEEVPTAKEAVAKGWMALPGVDVLTPGEQDVLVDVMRTRTPSADYKIRRADELNIKVISQSDLTGTYKVGPDGSIGVPWAGTLVVEDLTRQEAVTKLLEIYQPHFKSELAISVDVSEYAPMQVFVLGEVQNSKQVDLAVGGTLLEALSAAGGLKREKESPAPGRCAIARGNEKVVWVDLEELLKKGNLTLNVPLEHGDVIYVPDVDARLVHVMGQVKTAGPLELGNGMSLLEAVSKAGGATEDADLRMVFVLRKKLAGDYQGPVRADLKKLLESGDRGEDLDLEDGDVVFVARNDLADVGYVLDHLQTLVSAGTLIGLYTSPNKKSNGN